MFTEKYHEYINEGIKAKGGFQHPKLAESICWLMPLSFSSIDTDPESMKKRICFYQGGELTPEELRARYMDDHPFCNVLIAISVLSGSNIEAAFWDLSCGHKPNRIFSSNLALFENGILKYDFISYRPFTEDEVWFSKREFFSGDGTQLLEKKGYVDKRRIYIDPTKEPVVLPNIDESQLEEI